MSNKPEWMLTDEQMFKVRETKPGMISLVEFDGMIAKAQAIKLLKYQIAHSQLLISGDEKDICAIPIPKLESMLAQIKKEGN
jgi:hypothetical protein